MSGWAESSGHLTELQNGFRPNRRLEDNLFVVTQCIEVARKQSRGLLTCFLDVAKAYDSVPHDLMLRRMTELGMPQEWTRRLYADSSVVARLADTSSEPVKVSRGLRQGCPLSPLLYMLYASGLESALIQSNTGFKMKFLSEGQPEVWTLPGLVFADDIVLLAEDRHQLQQLVTISAHHLAGLGLRFNPQKSSVVQFAGEVDTNLPLELPNGDKLPFSTEYRYLGVTIDMGEGQFLRHEDRLRQTSQRASCILRRRSLWGCNRYVLVRELWKSVHVPCLTFANAIICLTSRTREWLERGQREVGRLALGCHGRVAVEAIQGDVGWSTFEAREATSKIAYEGRLRFMNDHRWARRMFRYLHFVGLRTQWLNRVYFLRRKYGMLDCSTLENTERKFTAAVRKRIREEESAQWQMSLQQKSTLQLYRTYKEVIAPESLYDNSGGKLSPARARRSRKEEEAIF
ncbi:uncharacterized protein LOC119391121 [Rhipicephalus sanguineus]|uniref:uncharacterized protein LOC119391121 n=1 Tax=Rhipicephalus sanguineus TaxID=34632 RepID=UPI00189597ED|nr:uncharacterized protein LOC119391121 [Rhipicephalus sanguineus]